MTVVMHPLYKKPVAPPADIPNAYYGVAPSSLVQTHSSVTAALPERLTIITDQTINLTVPAGQYGWFYIRASIENVRFMDIAVSLYGGWDGASWDGDNIGETSGPVTIMAGADSWHLFRTDFAALGSRTFRVSFTAPVDEVVVPPPPAAPTAPLFGVGALADYNESTVLAALNSNHTYTTGQNFTVTLANNFAYFALPASYNPIFIDQSSGYQGGWDGASWDTLGNIGNDTGPVAITIAGQPWKIYRTDFALTGSKTYKVNY